MFGRKCSPRNFCIMTLCWSVNYEPRFLIFCWYKWFQNLFPMLYLISLEMSTVNFILHIVPLPLMYIAQWIVNCKTNSLRPTPMHFRAVGRFSNLGGQIVIDCILLFSCLDYNNSRKGWGGTWLKPLQPLPPTYNDGFAF